MNHPLRSRIVHAAHIAFLALAALVLSVAGAATTFQPAQAQDGVPAIEIVDVDPGEQVIIRLVDFPPNLPLTASMGTPGTLGDGAIAAGSLLSPQEDMFVASLRIPPQLAGSLAITLRLENDASGITAYNTFQNVSGLGGPADDIPMDIIPNTGGSPQPAVPTCAQFYTVQPGQTLADIALQFNTTSERLVEINNLQSPSEIFAGQRMCVLLAGDIVLPPTDGGLVQPILAVVSVDPGLAVTVRGSGFPPNTPFSALIGLDGTEGINGIPAGSISTPHTGTFRATFTIPAALQAEDRLAIRLENQALGLFAYNSFDNDIREVAPVLPITGADPALEVTDVDPGDDVTVRAQFFPAGVTLNVLIGPSGGGQYVQVDAVTVPSDGAFMRTFNLPAGLEGEAGLLILFEDPVSGFSISQIFGNLGVDDPQQDRLFPDPDLVLPPQADAITYLNADLGETATIAKDNSGLSVVESGYDAVFSIARYETDVATVDGLVFTQPLIRVGVTDPGGIVLTDVLGLNYVFFAITEENRAAIDAGLLNIYYYDPQDAAWEQCDVQVQLDSSEGQGPADRLACVIEDFGLFGLASGS